MHTVTRACRMGILLIIFILPAFLSCASISKSTVSVTPSIGELDPGVYAFLPVTTAPTPENQKWPTVKENAAETVTAMLVAGFLDILPVVVDRNQIDMILTELNFQNLSGLTEDQASTLGKMLNADAVISVYLAEYNASRVSISVNSMHVSTAAILWSADVTARVGGISLDIEKAAERAVNRIIRDLDTALN